MLFCLRRSNEVRGAYKRNLYMYLFIYLIVYSTITRIHIQNQRMVVVEMGLVALAT